MKDEAAAEGAVGGFREFVLAVIVLQAHGDHRPVHLHDADADRRHLKMRGSSHEKNIRELVIDSSGAHIGAPFRNVAGILAGNPVQVAMSELERLDQLFPDERSS